MARLTITRERRFVNALRAYQVFVDGECIGKIRRGETKEFEIPSGSHTVELRIDWCRSNRLPIVADAGEPLILRASSNIMRAGHRSVLWCITVGTDSYLDLRPA